MPFTFAHPLSVLPFAKTGLLFSALVVGSMTPDFIYLINFAPQGRYGHSMEGLFVFCLPVGLAVLWLFHRFMKKPLAQFFPLSHQRKLSAYLNPFRFTGLQRFLLVGFSLLLGALTHIIWDGFTHEYGWMVERWPVLSLGLFATPFGEAKVYKFLQYAGHLAGIPAMAYFYYRWLRTAPSEQAIEHQLFSRKTRNAVLLGIVFGSFLVAFLYGLSLINFSGSLLSVYRPVGAVVVMGINLFLLGIFLYCLFWNYTRSY